jgi:hypothetical protein
VQKEDAPCRPQYSDSSSCSSASRCAGSSGTVTARTATRGLRVEFHAAPHREGALRCNVRCIMTFVRMVPYRHEHVQAVDVNSIQQIAPAQVTAVCCHQALGQVFCLSASAQALAAYESVHVHHLDPAHKP